MESIGNISRDQSGKLASYYKQDDYYFDGKRAWSCGSGVVDLKSRLEAIFPRFRPKSEIKSEHVLALTEGRPILAKDLTMSAPKSVSLIHALAKDKGIRKRVAEAHHEAVEKTLKEIEQCEIFIGRKKINGMSQSVTATGMISVNFDHGLSREEDPQLHTHCLIINSATDAEGKNISVNYRAIYKAQKKLDVIYKSVLRQALERAGFRTYTTPDGFEIDGISREQIEQFSKRLEQIKEALKRRGDGNGKDYYSELFDAKMRTRRSKSTFATPEIRTARWQEECTACGLDVDAIEIKRHKQSHSKIEKVLNDGWLDFTHRHAVFDEQAVIIELINYANSEDIPLSPWQIRSFLKREEIADQLVDIPGQDKGLMTTRDLLQADYENRLYLEQGKEKFRASNLGDIPSTVDEAARDLFDFAFQGEQRDAAIGILASRDFLTCVQGDPGTGKTTMLEAVVNVHDQDQVIGLAKAGAAAKKLGDETGIEARTIDRFVIDYDRREDALSALAANPNDRHAKSTMEATQYIETALVGGHGLIVVDEASMLGSKDANAICRIAAQHNARIVAVGDRQQLPGVGAGRPFEEWQELGAQTYRLKEIRRQRTEEERLAVEAITRHDDARRAVDILATSGEGKVRVIPNEEQRKKLMVADYFRHRDESGLNPLLITSLNKDREAFNDMIRTELVSRGEIASVGLAVTIQLQDRSAREREFAIGDRIVFLKNSNPRDLPVVIHSSRAHNNSDRVLNSTQGRVVLIDHHGHLQVDLGDGRSARIDPAKYNHIDHAYAISTYKAQGQSVEQHVMYHAPSSSSLLTKNEFLVGISRNKNNVTLYTDDQEEMINKASDWVYKRSALERYEIGQEREQPSAYVKAIQTAIQAKDARDTQIKLRRQELVFDHKDKWANVPVKDRHEINDQYNQSRKAFDAQMEMAKELRSSPSTRLELELASRHARWERDRAQVVEREVTEGLRGANLFRTINKVDREFAQDFDENWGYAAGYERYQRAWRKDDNLHLFDEGKTQEHVQQQEQLKTPEQRRQDVELQRQANEIQQRDPELANQQRQHGQIQEMHYRTEDQAMAMRDRQRERELTPEERREEAEQRRQAIELRQQREPDNAQQYVRGHYTAAELSDGETRKEFARDVQQSDPGLASRMRAQEGIQEHQNAADHQSQRELTPEERREEAEEQRQALEMEQQGQIDPDEERRRRKEQEQDDGLELGM